MTSPADLKALAERVEALIEATLGPITAGATRCKGGWIIDGRAKASPDTPPQEPGSIEEAREG